MKSLYSSIQLFLMLLLGISATAQTELDPTLADANTVASAEGHYDVLPSADENAYEQHTLLAQEAIRSHLLSSLSYSELLYAHRVEGRVVICVDIAADGTLFNKVVHQSLSSESDALALTALEGLVLPEGPYLGVRTIYIPVDFKLD